MTQTILNSPDFEFFQELKPPFGIGLFYLYTSVVSVCTSSHFVFLITSTSQYLNCVIQSSLFCRYGYIFSSAIVLSDLDRAVDEFLALFSNKTLEYIRAPDEDTFCPPFNLIRVLFLLPSEPFLPAKMHRYITRTFMTILFFPSLCLIAFYESKY